MTLPVFPLTANERAAIYGIPKRYPAAFAKKFEFSWTVFGFKIHPSMSVSGLVEKLIGPEPQ